jgi:DNA-binding Xre family transcriptional regulator
MLRIIIEIETTNRKDVEMPIKIDFDRAILKWQAKHGRRITHEELATEAGMSIASYYRLKKGDSITPDLNKINALCKVLECELEDIMYREKTRETDEVMKLEVERAEVLNKIDKEVKRKMSLSAKDESDE